MMKILNVIGSLNIGGAENNAMNILRFIDTSKFTYHFLVFGDLIGDYEEEAKSLGAIIIHVDEPKKDYWKFLSEYQKLLKQEQYTVVHVNTLWNSGLLLRSAKKEGVPTRICHSHSTESSQNENTIYRIYKRVMRKSILKNATHFVACGKDAGNYLYGENFFKRHGEIIYNGIDHEKFSFDSVKREEIRNSLEIDTNDIVMGHVGRIAPVKNHVFMVNILSRLSGDLPSLKLILVGDGPDTKSIKELVKSKGLEKKVLFLGNKQNVSDFLHGFDIFIFPSLFEGFPVSIIEAQAAGLPCLVSDRVTKEAQLTVHTQFLALKNRDKWLEKVRYYAENKVNRSEVSITKIKNKFSITAIAKQWEKLYEEEINEGLYNDKHKF
ncbi:MAG: glycosyltransferase family 1 protein [Carnobacterium sp.]|uniref:glycosyltransferase family 1 protein n=1 Tax=Carnobacterium sp. TaxID=48221 RepID=UPI003315AA12